MNPIWKKFNFTPNHLTTISIIFGGLSSYYVYKDNRILGAILFIIAYFFDCCDGNYARTYNMVTKFGDKYDHYGDLVKLFTMLLILYFKNKIKLLSYMPYIIIISILSTIHLGCQQQIYNSSNDEVMNNFIKLCPNKEYIIYTRYFGLATGLIYSLYLIVTI